METNTSRKVKAYHPDILFIRSRLEILLEWEEYERAVVLKRWIDELLAIHHNE